MKNIISIILIFVLLSSFASSALAILPSETEILQNNNSENLARSNNTALDVTSVTAYSEENQQIINQKEKELYEKALQKNNSNDAKSTSAYLNVPLLTQETNYWCGVAATLQLIKGINGNSSIGTRTATHAWSYNCWYGPSGSCSSYPHTCVRSITSEQCKLDYQMGIVPFGGADWNQISVAANSYSPSFTFGYRRVTTGQDLATRLASTVVDDHKPCIVLVDAGYLYENPAWGAHYITVYGYNMNTGYVATADPNYHNSYNRKLSYSISTLITSMTQGTNYNLLW